jgi:hypothetical protein
MQGKLINLKGQVFGTLTVIRRSYPWEVPGYGTDEHRRKTRQARWVCQCTCGGVKVLISQNLRKGDHKCICKPAAVRRIAELVSSSSLDSRANVGRVEVRPAPRMREFAVETGAGVG